MKTIKDYIGKKFLYVTHPETVYTVQGCTEDLVKISWDGGDVHYGLSEVMRLFAEGAWEFIESPKLKINILPTDNPSRLPQDETDHLLSTLANKKRLMEDVNKIEYEYIGECNGNNGNGCFLDSCGQECGCFIRQPKQETLEEAAEKYVKINVAKNAAKLMYKEHFIAGAKWQQENSQSIVPYDAYNIEVFNIEADEDGKLFAYIGYKISNGNFHFNVVPFTEPKKEIKLEDVFNEEHYEIKEKLIKEQKPQDKTYTEQEVKDLLEIQRGNCYVALLSHTKNDDIASVALGAPEPGGKNGTWIK